MPVVDVVGSLPLGYGGLDIGHIFLGCGNCLLRFLNLACRLAEYLVTFALFGIRNLCDDRFRPGRRGLACLNAWHLLFLLLRESSRCAGLELLQ